MNIFKLYQFLLTNWSRIITFRNLPGYLRHIVLFGSYGRHGKVSLLIFAEEDLSPCAVVKIPLFQSNEFLEQEYKVLTDLYEYPHIRKSIPKILYYDNWEGTKILIETVISGSSIKKELADNLEKVLFDITDWLIEFQLETSSGILCNDIWYKNRILEPLCSIKEKAKLFSPGLAGNIDILLNKLQSLNYDSLPLYYAHNDFRMSNLFFNVEGSISVADWEFSNSQEFPLGDLLFVFADIIAQNEQISYRKAVNRLINGTNSLNNVIRRAIQHYCKRLNIHESILPDLFLLFGLNRVILSDRLAFSLQSFDGIEWARDSLVVLDDLINPLEKDQNSDTFNFKSNSLPTQ